MSYILEALQKSEHARHRGKVPDLNTVPETTPNVTGQTATPRPPYLTAGFAVALAAAILGWWRPWQASQPATAAPTPTAVATAAEAPRRPAAGEQTEQRPAQAKQDVLAEAGQAATPAPLAAPSPVAPRTAPSEPAPAAAAPVAPPALEPLAPVRTPAAAPEPAKTVAPVAKARREPPESERPAPTAEAAPIRRSESSQGKSTEGTPPAPAASRKRPDGRILNMHELPAAVRSSLPRLSISGFAAAPDSGKRMVVINDRLVQEGEEVVPGVTLTSAEKDAVVLDYQGYRFRAQQ
ncbi:general secretion pathway protein GspB [Aromatoleum toluclasticum]|uniref:general secretion pathway protein GspB n=1 Tax=Aromatoleum toluclasticum TaxID=92003 RepID=UPI001D192C2A|nr:general secretion pathway protein GspB [Aromatoleum toluclasticum]MCC4118708.1 general secretion pathway protein GspB [Aromatoleum toluclasticum]